MNRIISLVVVLVCFILIGWGIAQKMGIPIAPTVGVTANIANNQTEISSTPVKAELASDTAPIAVAVKNDVPHYYPDNGSTVGDATQVPTPDPSRGFQITPTLIAKMYLADKYNPGICFGAPVSPPTVAVVGLLTDQKPLADFLRQHYNLTSDLEVYNKIKQFQDITLVETASSQFTFKFMDGQCQNVTYFEGTAKVSGIQVTDAVTLRQDHTYQ